MDQAQGQHKSNIARPLSRLPMARASGIPTPSSEPSKQSHIPRASISNSKKPIVKPLGEGGNVPVKSSSFGWSSKIGAGIISSILSSSQEVESPLAITSSELPGTTSTDENAISEDVEEIAKPTKRKPRPSLSERTVETLSQISPAPSPTRRRSSTIKSNGSMGPPARPASAMRNRRPSTPSEQKIGNLASPVKRHFRPPGKPKSPARERAVPPLDAVYTPPKAFMRDHSSRIGRPSRNDRRSISSNMSTVDSPKAAARPQAARVKSLYDLRATSATLSHKPSLPTLRKEPTTPQNMPRKASLPDNSSHIGLLKARSPGENVLAVGPRPNVSHRPAGVRKARRIPTPKTSPTEKKVVNKDAVPSDASKSSAALRDTIAKAKAAKREQLRKSAVDNALDQEWPSTEPMISLGTQSLKKKLQNAVTSGSLNLSAMSLRQLPDEVLHMYDFNEDSGAAWAEAVDLIKLILADNEIETLTDSTFPDWTEEQMMADSDKSNQFAGLETLDLHNNLLTSLPIGIRRLNRLQTLNLSGNKLSITVLEIVNQLQSLNELRFCRNGLNGDLLSQTLSITNLQILDLSDNQLESLPAGIANLQNLQKLILGNNRFASLPLDEIPSNNLTELDLSKNALGKSFDTEGLRRFQKLQTLDLSFNSLENLDAGSFDLPVLQTLRLHNNRVETAPDLSKCFELTTLTLSENRLVSVPEGLYSLTRLRNVDLSGNSIKVVDPEISGMESLVTLNLAGNPLRQKKYLTMNAEEIKADMVRKSTLDDTQTTSQSVTEITEQTAPVQESKLIQPKNGILDASSRSLSTLHPDQVDLSKPVHTIRLANNDFTTFPVELLLHSSVRWSLRSFDISHNPSLHPIDHLATEVHLPLLQSLYVVSTGLTTLETLTTYLKAPELRELNISCHRLTGHLPWVRAWYPTITTLLASDNWFDSIDVEAARGLEVLDVRCNEIASLPPKLGLLGNHAGKKEPGRLRSFECSGNRFRIPRPLVIERGTEAVLRDLRRMIPASDVPGEWAAEI